MPSKVLIALLSLSLLASSHAASASATKSESEPKNRSYYEKRGEILWEIQTDEKVIALTFDDGPDPNQTPRILDVLKENDIKATFFTVGQRAVKAPELILREVAEGHEIANHTYTHPFFARYTSVATIAGELQKTEDAIFQITGAHMHLFRPPGGLYEDNILSATKQMGYMMILWSWNQDTRDWARPGVGSIVRKALSGAHNGGIVLFHDYVHGGSQTVDALKQILPVLKERGYRFVTVSELMSYQQKEE